MDRTGCIYWLPERNELTTAQLHGNSIPMGGFYHPVLVLQTNGDVHIVLLDVLARHPNSPARRLAYLPIHPSPPHPDTGDVLRLARGTPTLRKESYVKISERYAIRAAALALYDRRSRATYRLKGKSLKLILRKLAKLQTPLSGSTVTQPPRPADLAAAQHLQRMMQAATAAARTTYVDRVQLPQRQTPLHYGTVSAASVSTPVRHSNRTPARAVEWTYSRPVYVEQHANAHWRSFSVGCGNTILLLLTIVAFGVLLYAAWGLAMYLW